LRQDVLTAFHVLDAEGQNSGIAGHVSARVPEAERILGHSYGLAFDEVTADEIREDSFALEAAGPGGVSPSLAFHVSIYRARPDVMAIVHTHPRASIVLGAAGATFTPAYQSALMLYEDVAILGGYDGIIENEAVGARMAETLGDKGVLLLRNHGIVAVGRSVAEAVCRAVIFEENAAIQLAAMAVGTLHPFPEEAARQARGFLASERIIAMRWAQLARKARRSSPLLAEALAGS